MIEEKGIRELKRKKKRGGDAHRDGGVVERRQDEEDGCISKSCSFVQSEETTGSVES
jgi:hypothetical protein